MKREDVVIVVLAAGKGTRLRSRLAKVLHRVGGLTLVEHVVRACLPLGAPTVVVVGHQAEDVRALVEPAGAKTVLQQPQRGTGHALQVARPAVASSARTVLVVPGDAPLVRTTTLDALLRAHASGGAAAAILSAILPDPTHYGRIVRKKDGTVAAIVEERMLDEQERAIREVNSSIYAFALEKLWPALERLRPENVHNELYLTDAIALLHEAGETVIAVPVGDAEEIRGCNTRAELADADRIFRARKRAALMDAGVTMVLPETILVDADVVAGADTLVEPNVQLLGATRVGAGCTIRTGSVISDSVLDEGVTVRQHCVVSNSRLGAGVVVGPFAHLRDGAELRAGARVGNYVEVKKSVLHEGVKAMHLTYLGDASVGRDTNVGAGTITCNYDGVRKNPTSIGERVFVGSGTELVAPVKVGDGAYVAAGSTITEDVPADALAIARERQATKPGWAAARRARLASSPPADVSSSAAADPRTKPSVRKKKSKPARVS